MEKELLAGLNYLETERGIPRARLLEIVGESVIAAARKSNGPCEEMQVDVDSVSCKITATAQVTVVPHIDDVSNEIDLALARERYPDCEIGDNISWPVDVNRFGRVAAQAYRQAFIYGLNMEEKRIACEEYKDRVGEIISGEIKNFVRGEYIVDFGKVDGVLLREERIPTEEFQIGERVNVLLKEIDEERTRSFMIVSRRDPKFVEKLFEREVTEIADGLIEIKGVARDAGFRTKIAVHSTITDIDPVGACVGMRGSRVRSVVNELNGEKVDIVIWNENLETFVRNAMQPAELESVTVKEKQGFIQIVAREDQYSLAIGRRGQNARLASQLVDWKIDISKAEPTNLEGGFEAQLQKAVSDLSSVEEIGEDLARALVNAGFLSVAGIKVAEVSALMEVEGISEEKAEKIKEAVAEM
jgi:N utilization substance protein A